MTSANHGNTRRNPVPYHRREAAIERFSVLTGLRSVVVPVFDVVATDRFAEVTVKTVAAVTGLELTPADTVLACSTPEVAAMYRRLGFPVAGVEADVDPPRRARGRAAAVGRRRRQLAGPGPPGERRRLRPVRAGRPRPVGGR
ncbi:hypothetical protein [Micromonospora sp. LOL_021]|uniref:hypothetical protein n=1 Tax=Micromonospora sp. LOL_021 TaxID=3345417 RepID=UPI003A8A5F16